MNLIKRTLTILLCMAMIITYMPVSVIAYTGEAGDALVEELVADQAEPAAAEAEEPAPATEAEEPAPATEAEEPAPAAEAEEPAPAEEESPAEEAVPAEDKTSEETAEPADEDAKAGEKAESKAEDKKLIDYTKELETVAVKVTAPEEAFSEEVDLVVKQLDKDKKEDKKAFQEAEDALAENKQTYDGILAFDIHFENSKGKEIEPNGTVSVEMTAKEAAFKDVDPEAINVDSVQVTHIGDEATVVADNADKKVDGTVEIEKTENAVQKVDVEFEVDGFSTYTLTWTEGGTEKQAIIHWGTVESNGDFNDIKITDVADMDTSAASISVANTFEGYTYIGTVYSEDGSFTDDDVDMDQNLEKTDSGWQVTKLIKDDEGKVTKETAALKDGDHIYVVYSSNPADAHGQSSATVDGPDTVKKVIDNDDGTKTIQLDVTAPQSTETEENGANILIVLDRTYSMRTAMGQGTRWSAALSAVNILVNELKTEAPGIINYSYVSFYRVADSIHTWSGTNTWTKDADAFNTYVQGLSANSNTSQTGTNWEAGLVQAVNALGSRDTNNPTYVIFLTDGEPNRYSNNTTNTYINPNNTTTCINNAIDNAQSITAMSNVKLYGIFAGTDNGASNLRTLINGANGEQTINATSQTAIEDAFANIASIIVTNLGSSEVSVDDGIPKLSSVSANVSGTVGGYEYYISTKENPTDNDFETWTGAPGASFSEDNGVTWDLSNVGTLIEGTTYRIRFKVWPSQKAYDILANLNNGTVSYDELPSDQQSQIYESSGKYYLKTNTHLKTTYSYNGTTYTDNYTWTPNDMLLESTQMKVTKIWEDSINPRNRADGVEFYLLVDGEYYQNNGTLSNSKENAKVLDVNKNNSWLDSIYIAPGFALVAGGENEVLETGHAYRLEEKAAYHLVGEAPNQTKDYDEYESYSMEFDSQTVRPMEIDGVLKYLVLIENPKHPKPSSGTFYRISGDTITAITASEATDGDYYVGETGSDGSGTISGKNFKTSELDITKVVNKGNTDKTDEELDAETFTYKVTLIAPADSDYSGVKTWIYRQKIAGSDPDNKGYTLPEYASTGLGAGYEPEDYNAETQYIGNDIGEGLDKGKSVSFTESGDMATATVYITINRSEIIRVTNLPTGATYEIVEVAANAGAAGTVSTTAPSEHALKDEGYAVANNKSVNGESSATTIDKDTLSGTIATYNTRYYNQFTNVIKAVDVDLEGVKALSGYKWSGETYTFNLTSGSNTDPVPYDDKNIAVTSVDYNGTTDTSESVTKPFGRIRFTAAGEYTYTITEKDSAGNESGAHVGNVTYGGPVKFKVNVIEQNGKLVVERVEGDDVSFVGGTITATITNEVEKRDLDITKIWDDASDQDGKRPDTITIAVKAGTKTVMTIVAGLAATAPEDLAEGQTYIQAKEDATDSNKWHITVEDLDKFASGAEITYSIVEDAVANYNDPAYSEDGLTVTNSRTPEVVTKTITKVWDDNNNQDGIRPASVEVVLTGSDGKEYKQTLTGTPGTAPTGTDPASYESAAWTATFVNLPKNAGGTEITYTYSETETAVITGNDTATTYAYTWDGSTVTNKHTPAVRNIDGVKKWDDDEYTALPESAGYERPASVTVTITGEIEGGITVPLKSKYGIEPVVTTTEAKQWKYGWENLPVYHEGKPISYSITEELPNGYSYINEEANPFNLINTPVEKELIVDPVRIKKLDSITGEPLPGAIFTLKDSDGNVVATATSSETGEGELEIIKEGTYTLTETAPEGYTSDPGSWTIEVSKSGVYKVTYNTDKKLWSWFYHLLFGDDSEYKDGVLTVPNTPAMTKVTANKVWNDNNDKDKKRPTEIELTLTGTAGTWTTTDTKTVKADSAGNWSYTWDDLAGYHNGTKISYSVTEKAIAEYKTKYDPASGVSGDVTNGYTVNITNSRQSTPVKDVVEVKDNKKVSIDGETVNPGDVLNYEITYINTTGDTADKVVITDAISKYTTYNNDADQGGTFKDGVVTWTFEEVADGTAITVTFSVTVKDDVSGETIVNKGVVDADGTKLDTNEVTNPTPPKKTAYTGGTKVLVDGDVVKPNEEITYEIKYTNTSGKTLEKVEITDTIPDLTELVDNGGATVSGKTLKWTFENVESGKDVTVKFVVKVSPDVAGETITNKANVVTDNNKFETNEVSNPTPPKKEVFAEADTAMKTNIDGQEVKAGDVLTYKITYNNTTEDTVNAIITDNVPDYTTYVADSQKSDPAGATFTEKDGELKWTADVATGKSLTVSFQVKVDEAAGGQTIENTGKFRNGENGKEIETNPVKNPVTTEVIITKDLTNFVDHGKGEKATFAFQIIGTSATRGEYKNVVAMEFDSSGTNTLTVVGLPSDIQNLEVDEIVTGNYAKSTDGVNFNKTTGKWEVTFTNTYDDTEYKTGTINNYKRGTDGKYTSNGTGNRIPGDTETNAEGSPGDEPVNN